MNPEAPLNPVTRARRKQRQGIPLNLDEQALLRNYYGRYNKQKLTLHLRADRASEWQGLAESQGLSLAAWMQERVVEALHGFDDLVADVRRQNSDLHDSGDLIQTLLQHDLVDNLWLKIYPLTLGSGKRLFARGTISAAFTLRACQASPKGLIVANYARAGSVETGSF